MRYKFLLLILSISLLFSCKPNLKVPTPGKGNIDPTRYVAIGNSITSGFADGALYYQGQLVSFPNLIAQQLKLVGGGDFKQPLVPQNSIGVGLTGNAPFKLDYSTDCLHVTSLAPVSIASSGDASIFTTPVQGPFNNMGVPGAKAITVVSPGYGNMGNGAGNYNPFFARMASSPTTSILSDAMLANPTFFSVFIGNNDVLAYATNGGSADAITPSAGAVGVGFDASIQSIVNTLVSNNAKGVIGNVPDITSLPYFTTIPYNGLTLTAAQAAQLNGTHLPFPPFKEGNNPFIIQDTSNHFYGARPIKPGELI